ncbi:MAG: diguanylate cyclase, partial [Pseudomonadota bacterium]|nr:diguanylate cyclase [Pseudomonadota bacterium]
MNRKDNDGASGTDDSDIDKSGQPDLPGQHKDRLPSVLEKNITRRESAVIDDEAAVLSREKSATTRE